MPNEKGWHTKEEAEATGLPCFIKRDSTKPGHWTHEPYEHAVLLTRTRCKELGMPALRDGKEAPSAFRYANGASHSYRYVPLYDRTDVFEAGELSYSILKDGEMMGIPTKECSVCGGGGFSGYGTGYDAVCDNCGGTGLEILRGSATDTTEQAQADKGG